MTARRGCTLGRMSDPTHNVKPAAAHRALALEVELLALRAEKVWLEKVIEAGEMGGNGVDAAEVVSLLRAQARRGPSAGG